MALNPRESAQTLATGVASVQRPGRLQRRRSVVALPAPMFWKTGLQPGLSRLRRPPLAGGPRASPSWGGVVRATRRHGPFTLRAPQTLAHRAVRECLLTDPPRPRSLLRGAPAHPTPGTTSRVLVGCVPASQRGPARPPDPTASGTDGLERRSMPDRVWRPSRAQHEVLGSIALADRPNSGALGTQFGPPF